MDVVTFNQKVLEVLEECTKKEDYFLSPKFSFQREISDYPFEEDEVYEELLENSKNLQGDCIPLHIGQKYKLTKEQVFLSIEFGTIIDNLKTLQREQVKTFGECIYQSIQFGMNLSMYKRDEFFYFDLVLQSARKVKIVISEKERLPLKYFDILLKKRIKFERDGKKNFEQQIGMKFPFEECYGFIVFCKVEKPLSIENVLQIDDYGNDEIEKQLCKINVFRLLFYENTFRFLNERKYDEIFNRTKILCNTFYWFLIKNIKPKDRLRYVIAGSVIKSAYGLRDAKDIDFFVLDHEDNIEKYSSYKPDIGIKGYFDDFGKTYYSNEKFYNPMIPKFYEKQKHKKEININEKITILNNYPKYSVSGLKAGRYFDIFKGELKKMGVRIESIDDIVFDPQYKIYFMGLPLIDLKIELMRDHIKDIDLQRMSKKQMFDFKYLSSHYDYLFTKKEKEVLCLHKFSYKISNESKIKLPINIYHTNMNEESFGVLIKKAPLYVNEMIEKMIKDGPLLIFEKEVKELDYFYIVSNPLLSTLPQYNEKKEELYYEFNLKENGEFIIHISRNEERIKYLVEKIIISGTIRVFDEDYIKRIKYSVDFEDIKHIKYKRFMVNFMKTIIQLHKLVDCHTLHKLQIEYQI